MLITHLRWRDVAPSKHPVDPAIARALAGAVLSRVPEQASSSALRAAEDSVDRALVAEYGPWASGWRWAASEPGGGGPVHAWCCAEHSLDCDHHERVERVVAAVEDLRAWLEALEARFEALRREVAAHDRPEAASRAAARLLPDVIERTGAQDAWYATFERVLAWYLEDELGDDARALVRAAIGGRFESWTVPADATRDGVLDTLAARVATRPNAPPSEDALAAWRRLRSRTRWLEERRFAPDPVRDDGHLRYVERADRRRDSARADRMRAAIAAVRARASEPLTVQRLVELQRVVLGRDAPLRTTDAFAKGGRERYPAIADLAERLAESLADAEKATPSVVARAARVYLDLSFLHPFDDGNARAARLALDHVLTRAGLALHAAEPIVALSLGADDPQSPIMLQLAIDHLAGPIAR